MTKPNYNLIRFIRRCIYQMKREYGGPITVYRLINTGTDLQTGVKTVNRDSIDVVRAVVLPNRLTREAIQSISVISADKKIVQGGTYDHNYNSHFQHNLSSYSNAKSRTNLIND